MFGWDHQISYQRLDATSNQPPKQQLKLTAECYPSIPASLFATIMSCKGKTPIKYINNLRDQHFNVRFVKQFTIKRALALAKDLNPCARVSRFLLFIDEWRRREGQEEELKVM